MITVAVDLPSGPCAGLFDADEMRVSIAGVVFNVRQSRGEPPWQAVLPGDVRAPMRRIDRLSPVWRERLLTCRSEQHEKRRENLSKSQGGSHGRTVGRAGRARESAR